MISSDLLDDGFEEFIKAKNLNESIIEEIIISDENGIIFHTNPAEEKTFGRTPDELISQQSIRQNICSSEESTRIRKEISEKLRITGHWEGEFVDRKRDGGPLTKFARIISLEYGRKKYVVSLTISPILDSSGQITGASEIARNISEQKRMEKQREELLMREKAARAEAQAANRSKDEFISLVSHELRSPLNSILIYSQMLSSNPDDAEQVRQTCEIIQRNTRTQLRLIEDLLDTARIVQGKLRLDQHPIDIVPVLADVLNVARPMADAKGVKLQIADCGLRIEEEAPYPSCPPYKSAIGNRQSAIVMGDSVRLQQAIGNLLSNAIKFTPEGGRVELSLERSNKDLRIAISDTGMGIDPQALPHIFDRYRRSDSSNSRRHGGPGLGLALAKHLVELHGGTIEAASEGTGLGSTFTIRLPLAWRTEVFEAEPLAICSEGAIKLPVTATVEGIRVLAVDDQQEVRVLLTNFLSKYGARVTAVSSGSEALSILAALPNEEQPDVLICDISMPGEDGYTVMERVRALERQRGIKMSQRIPAIALTALTSREDWVRALKAGFNMHIAKPVELAELITVISSLVRDRARV
jgi:PAS domain S-box-containing protein